MGKIMNEKEIEIGRRIKKIRLKMNMTQDEVAERTGLTIPTISRLESGRGSSMSTFIKVADLLGEGNWIDSFAPEVSISPYSMKKYGKERERVRKKR